MRLVLFTGERGPIDLELLPPLASDFTLIEFTALWLLLWNTPRTASYLILMTSSMADLLFEECFAFAAVFLGLRLISLLLYLQIRL